MCRRVLTQASAVPHRTAVRPDRSALPAPVSDRLARSDAVLRRLSASVHPVSAGNPPHAALRFIRMELEYLPRRQFFRRLLLLYRRQSVCLSHPAVSGQSAAVRHAVFSARQVCTLRRVQFSLSPPVCPYGHLRRHRRSAVYLFRIHHHQYELLFLSGCHRGLPAPSARHRAGRRTP